MAKRSKKGRRAVADARGYSTSTATTTTSKVAVTAAAHEGLTNLLADLKGGGDEAGTRTTVRAGKISDSCAHSNYLTDLKRTGHSFQEHPIDPSDSRFVKRVASISSRLLSLTFTKSQVESALTALGAVRGSDFDLELALDWLCLNLSSEELPSLFVEQDVQISALEDGGISVHSAVKRSGGNHGVGVGVGEDGIENSSGRNSAHELMDMMMASSRKKNTSETGDNPAPSSAGDSDVNEEEKAKQKALLLAQYQYEEVDGDEEQEEIDVEVNDEVGINEEVQSKNKRAEEISPQERQLAELQRQIEEDSAILNDEAALYLMSKYEVADLNKRIKKTQGQAKGLRGKVAKMRAERDRQLREEAGAVVDDNEEGGEVAFSLFGNDDDIDTEEAGCGIVGKLPSVEEKATEPAPLQCRGRSYGTMPTSSAIPKDWHGQTPKKLLEDHCRKKKMPAPKFSLLPRSKDGCKLVLQRTKGDHRPFVVEHPGPFHSFVDAQHYLSTEALFELSPYRSLYRLLPPIFRQIWMAWQDEEEVKQKLEASEERDRKDADVQVLINKIYAAYKGTYGSVPTAEAKRTFGEEKEDRADSTPALDDWDDQSSEDGTGDIDGVFNLINSKPTSRGVNLSKEYKKKTSTLAYQTMLNERKGLPIYSYRESIIRTVHENPVTVLCAATGAGKSTNAPLFLLEDALESGMGDKVNVICTQPRRVAAISVAERVSDQMNEEIGGSIGYHIRMDSKRSKQTKLMFCTSGVVIRRLQDDPELKGVTHICVDEVHERQWQIDFLLISLRRLVCTSRKDLKIVLVSFICLDQFDRYICAIINLFVLTFAISFFAFCR